MKDGSSEERSVTSKQALTILKKNGLEVTEIEVEKILDFLYFLAKLTVDHYISEADTAQVLPIPKAQLT